MDQTTLILIGIAFTVAAAVGGVAFAFIGAGAEARANKRVAAISRGDGRAGAKGTDAAGEAGAKRRRQVQETLKEIERKQEQVKARPSLAAMLEQADWSIDARRFYIITLGIGGATAVAFFLFGYAWYVALGAAFAIGFGFPRWLLG